MTTKCLTSLVLVLTILLCNTAFAGKIYKWKDANGVVHYSERAPGGIETETIRAATSSSVDQNDSIDDADFDFETEDEFANTIDEVAAGEEVKVDVNESAVTTDNTQATAPQDRAATNTTTNPEQETQAKDLNAELLKAQQLADAEALRQRNCASAKADISKLAGKSRVRVRNSDGSYKLLDDQELTEKRTTAQAYLDDRCK